MAFRLQPAMSAKAVIAMARRRKSGRIMKTERANSREVGERQPGILRGELIRCGAEFLVGESLSENVERFGEIAFDAERSSLRHELLANFRATGWRCPVLDG